MPEDSYLDDEPGLELVQAGSDIAGSVTGAAVGLLFGGPVGAVVGAAAGPAAGHTLRRVANEVSRRVMSPRERVRAGAAVVYAAERLRNLLDEGATIRDDGFFADTPGGRNAGREVAEGVLLKARSAFEERKARHIGYMFANIAVLEQIDEGLAALALHLAESLTWRQYVILAAVGRADRLPLPAGDLGDTPGAWTAWGALREFRDLHDAGCFSAPEKTTEDFDIPLINTATEEQRLAHQGRLLHYLLSLDLIEDVDVLELHDALRPVR